MSGKTVMDSCPVDKVPLTTSLNVSKHLISVVNDATSVDITAAGIVVLGTDLDVSIGDP